MALRPLQFVSFWLFQIKPFIHSTKVDYFYSNINALIISQFFQIIFEMSLCFLYRTRVYDILFITQPKN